jgi:RNA polymerase primary sigma factor
MHRYVLTLLLSGLLLIAACTRADVTEEVAEEAMLERDVAKVLETLNPRERLVLQLRFGLGNGNPHTLAEVGEYLDISRERVRQIENEALRKLRRAGAQRLHAYHMEI